MPGAQFFPEARINYAENMLRFSKDGGEGDAIVFWGEDKVKRRLSHAELHDRVSRLAQHLRSLGLQPGDRIAGFVPNAPEAVIGAFAAAAIGCIWSSCSPDFGVQGVLDRFGQIEPKVLITADGYWYGGKQFNSLARVAEFSAKLPSLQQILVFPYLSEKPDLSKLPKAKLLPEALAAQPGGPISYERVPFNHPLFIMYSSGTTGVPKCIVHGQGGTLLQHLKEHRLHGDVRPHDRLFYFTTCGWMMWNWLISGLGSNATLLLYDGSPFAAGGNILYDYAEAERCTLFGTSAKYIDACAKQGLDPIRTNDLSTVRMVTSTGSPLSPEGFDYVYAHVKKDVCSQLDLRRHRHRLLLHAGQSDRAGVARRDPDARPRPEGRGVERRRQAGHGREGRIGLRRAVPLHAGRILERSRRQALQGGVFRDLSQHLAPRRLCRADDAWRDHRLWPLRRRAQSRRRAHRHRGDLSPGRAIAGGGGEHRHRPGLGQ